MELLLNLLLLLLVVAGSIVFLLWGWSGYGATVSDEEVDKEVKRIQQERETEYQSEVDRLTDALMVAFDKVDKKKKRKSK